MPTRPNVPAGGGGDADGVGPAERAAPTVPTVPAVPTGSAAARSAARAGDVGDATAGAIRAETDRLCRLVGLELPEVTVQHPGPLLPGVFRVDVLAAAVVAATTAAVAEVEQARCGRRPAVAVDARTAQVSFRSERYLRRDGAIVGELWAGLSGDYRCADGWLKVHANFAHHGRAAAAALGVPAERDRLAAALASLAALDAEQTVIDAGGVAAALRREGDWAVHPQGRVEVATPAVRLAGLGAVTGRDRARPRPWPVRANGGGATDGVLRPLAGLRVLDLTRVIAGPVCGRVLAAHGADVLSVAAAHLPQIDSLLLDTGFGKRSTLLDLRRAADRAAFDELVAGADVLVESYRPGALAALGYGPEALAERSPGLVVVDVRAYSSNGPWAGRRGFDSLVQLVSGIADTARRAAGVEEPVPLPCQALDHGTGWLAALAAVAAVLRQRRDGGSWHAEVSLAATAAWLQRLGRLDGPGPAEPLAEVVAAHLTETVTPSGTLRHAVVPGTLDGRAPRWAGPPPAPGSSPPRWATAG